ESEVRAPRHVRCRPGPAEHPDARPHEVHGAGHLEGREDPARRHDDGGDAGGGDGHPGIKVVVDMETSGRARPSAAAATTWPRDETKSWAPTCTDPRPASMAADVLARAGHSMAAWAR